MQRPADWLFHLVINVLKINNISFNNYNIYDKNYYIIINHIININIIIYKKPFIPINIKPIIDIIIFILYIINII